MKHEARKGNELVPAVIPLGKTRGSSKIKQKIKLQVYSLCLPDHLLSQKAVTRKSKKGEEFIPKSSKAGVRAYSAVGG